MRDYINMELTINDWVKDAPTDQLEFRRVVHIILTAIALDSNLAERMVMKGGILMGLLYKNRRYTQDIDFSTSRLFDLSDDANKQFFIDAFDEALNVASVELMYGIKCKVQSFRVEPNKNSTFPGVKMTIGYANTQNNSLMNRLDRKESPHTVPIDYSFNEPLGEIQELIINDDSVETIKVYSLESLLAEKFRAILQQSVRKRSRRQDIYDIYHLMNEGYVCNNSQEKEVVLAILKQKSVGKNIDHLLHKNGLDHEATKIMAKKDYALIKDETEGDLPDFDKAYEIINGYFKSLPWTDSGK